MTKKGTQNDKRDKEGEAPSVVRCLLSVVINFN